MLASSFIIGVFVAPHFGWDMPSGPLPTFARVQAVFVVISWLFLVIASPFFLRSLPGVAFAGLIIALCVLVYGIVTFL